MHKRFSGDSVAVPPGLATRSHGSTKRRRSAPQLGAIEPLRSPQSMWEIPATGSTSTVVSQVVNQATSSATLTSSPNPSRPGQAVTFTRHHHFSAGQTDRTGDLRRWENGSGDSATQRQQGKVHHLDSGCRLRRSHRHVQWRLHDRHEFGLHNPDRRAIAWSDQSATSPSRVSRVFQCRGR
jgi:hypothetical protein